jgi:hypothetical protein
MIFLPSCLSVHSQKLDIGHPVDVIEFENVRRIGIFLIADLIGYLTTWYTANSAVTMLLFHIGRVYDVKMVGTL